MKAWMTAAALLCLAVPAGAWAGDRGTAEFTATTLNLSADGEVRVRPDLAVIDFGVQAEGTTAAAAFAEARRRMTAMVSTLRGQGVADEDVQTAQLNLQAQYADAEGRGPRRLTGYEASNTVSVRLHDLARVGAVVDALVSSGANTVNGISFQLADAEAAGDEARRRAVKALQAKAELYAQATGYRLQRLVSLSDGGGYAGSPRIVFAKRAMAQATTPIAAGELTVSASLSAQYELAR
ncbi:SIMPL domain-containing protein [Caulobacter sp. S45]|uniref:SIMPL domain-containing protein n=1 Tax=Caulobacter sp. S45 TaxID=1641861 RepID=UPI001575BFCA|nr:SIMPL domain-containing protein [Caulobacter sp. S45]